MHLTPREIDKLTLLTLGLIAERRLKKGLKLNHPEAVAYISYMALEEAREGKSLEQVMSDATKVLTRDDDAGGIRAAPKRRYGGRGRYDYTAASRGGIHRWLAPDKYSPSD